MSKEAETTTEQTYDVNWYDKPKPSKPAVARIMTPVEKISLRCVMGLIKESMQIIDNADTLIEVDSTKDLLLTAHAIISKIVGEQE